MVTTFGPPLVKLPARRFADAVAALVDEQPGWLDGRCVMQAGRYHRLRQSLTAKSSGAGRAVQSSCAPLRVDVLTWLAEVDRVTAGWGARQADTPVRLREMASRQWAPEDADRLDALAEMLEKWTVTATELLGDAPAQVPLRLRCPACGELWAYRSAGGERVRRFALVASEAGASCGACGAVWPVEKFDWLAKLLNSTPQLEDTSGSDTAVGPQWDRSRN